MNKISLPANWKLQGYRTYLVATAIFVLGLLHSFGIDVPGVEMPDNWGVLMLNALGLASVRSAIG